MSIVPTPHPSGSQLPGESGSSTDPPTFGRQVAVPVAADGQSGGGEPPVTRPGEPLKPWEEEELEAAGVFGDESTALIGSILVHLIVILGLALLPLRPWQDDEAVVLVSPPPQYEEEVRLIEQITYSETPKTEVGNNSEAEVDLSAASAEMFAEIAEIPNPIELESTELGQIMVNKMFTQAVAPLDRLEHSKGDVGYGTEGVTGAVDRLTFEILQSLEERPTTVVWLFDQSGSLHRQREQIRDRFDRIYDELGIVSESRRERFGDPGEIPVLTSIIGFGSSVTLYTEEPTDDLKKIKSIVEGIEVDDSGVERVFTAVESAADRYKSLRRSRGPNGPQRNVLFVVVTDERGDDAERLEPAIADCRKWGIPVYVIGVPAPFGREHTLIKYVDPDPNYDQTPQWAQVDQGPETLLPERVKVGFTGNFEQEPVIDSGFGPYALTRLCYETGGIYFTVHPNRDVSGRVRRRDIEDFASELEYFFDPNIMARYRPDYLAPTDYLSRVKSSPLRQALVRAAQMQPATGLARPRTRFVKRGEAELVGELTRAQQDAAKLMPRLEALAAALEPGLASREEETSPRWRAGFDLAMGRVLAQKVRTETYNLMLAEIKRGKAFERETSNTWVLEPSNRITVGSKWERQAETATDLLKGVVREHDGTPWALLAKQELEVPIGWEWKEEFTDLSPPPQRRPGNNNNNNPRPPSDDQKRMLKKPPKRPVPRL